MLDRVCIGCGKDFRVYACHVKKTLGSGAHCSNECRRRRVSKKCLHCDKDFENRLCQAHVKYCSRICYYQGKRVTKEHRLEKARINRRDRVARIYNAMGDFSINYFKWLCDRLNNICVMCDQTFESQRLTIDHAVPLTKDGRHDNSNIQPMCGSCNAKKGNKIVYYDKRVKKLYKEYVK